MADAGQWFERGVRVGYFPADHDPRRRAWEPAALGSYEVLDCTRVEAGDRRWLDVRLGVSPTPDRSPGGTLAYLRVDASRPIAVLCEQFFGP